ncbi:MAG: gamma-glutamyl-gamma-aminobutyrate hydrolase family protein [Ignavibacteriales bacterium]|nr:gamma-glutamyl-gamma-aminobutyrate hydrolase family protein [Ignavibacteriales bacterium]
MNTNSGKNFYPVLHKTMRIAVTDTGREEKQKIYLDWLRSFDPNAELIVVSHRKTGDHVSEFDGLVLTGGEDVDPQFSKAEPVDQVGKTDTGRDRFEFDMLDKALKKDLPILCICRGLQVANVHLGGTLIADLQHDGYNKHDVKEKEPVIRHSITVKENSIMHEITGAVTGEINSYHHQAVKIVAESLVPSAFSNDGVIESLEWKENDGKPYFLAVQWHPERMKDTENPFTTKIGASFFDAVRKNNTKRT